MTLNPSRTVGTAAALALTLFLATVGLHASDPIGVYGIIDRVTVTPAAGGSATVQIWGAFAVAVLPRPSGTYKPEDAYRKVAKGYLLFRCPAFTGSTCSNEVNDLKAMAGTGEVAGFGAAWRTPPRVRPNEEPAKDPDPYELNVGVVKLGKFGDYPTIAAALKAAASPK